MSYRLITVLFVRVTCRCFPVHSSNARCISRRRSRTAPGRTRAGSSGERRHGGVRGRWVAQRGTGSLRRRRRDGRGGQQGAAGAAASVPAAPRGSARRAVYPQYNVLCTMVYLGIIAVSCAPLAPWLAAAWLIQFCSRTRVPGSCARSPGRRHNDTTAPTCSGRRPRRRLRRSLPLAPPCCSAHLSRRYPHSSTWPSVRCASTDIPSRVTSKNCFGVKNCFTVDISATIC